MRAPVRIMVRSAVLLAALGATGLTAAAPAAARSHGSVPPDVRDQVVTRIPTHHKVVALTFDGGAGRDAANSILATLAAKHVSATFMLTGTFAKNFPTLCRRLAAAGRIGDHSMTHPYFTQLSDAQVRAQLTDSQRVIKRKSHVDPQPFFRFPFGAYDAHLVHLVNHQGWVAVGWTVDSLGWEGTSGGQTVASVVDRVLAARIPGEIVLMHLGANPNDGSTLDADALPAVIHRLRRHGYEFVTLDALLPAHPG